MIRQVRSRLLFFRSIEFACYTRIAESLRGTCTKGERQYSFQNSRVKEPLENLTAANYCPPPCLPSASRTQQPLNPAKLPSASSSSRSRVACSSSPSSSKNEKNATGKSAPAVPSAPCQNPKTPPPAYSSQSGSSGGGSGASKLLFGLIAGAIGAGAAYYVFVDDDKKTSVKKGQSGVRGLKKQRLVQSRDKVPATSTDLPKHVHYLLIGGGTASFSAFRSIKSLDPKAEVLLIGEESEKPYMRPPLSKEMWNSDRQMRENKMFRQWNGSVRSLYFEPDSFYMDPIALPESSKGGVAMATGWKVTHIDVQNKQVTLDDGTHTITYDKCLLAPGSKTKPFPLLENAAPEVREKMFYFRNIFDFQDLSHATECGKKVVIIGGGFLGSELASSLTHNGCQVTQVFRESGLIKKVLPSYLSNHLAGKLAEEGVKVLSGSEVTKISSKDNQLIFTLSTGDTIEADYCVVATGAVPNTDLAETSNLETHPTLGGYMVNTELLARSNLYVAGDAACFFDRYGRRRVEHHDHAVVSGRLAGENMVGGPGKPYTHASMLWSDLSPDLGFEGVGVLDSSLPTTGVFALSNEAKTSETQSTVTATDDNTPATELPQEKFEKGVVFYLKDGIIVGILLWNIFSRTQLARQILKEERKFEDLNEVAKLFRIHED